MLCIFAVDRKPRVRASGRPYEDNFPAGSWITRGRGGGDLKEKEREREGGRRVGMARISGALGRSCYVEVHETAEISPLPARGTNPRAHGQGRTAGPYTHAEMQRRACAYRALCTTHDRELAPPSAPVGQSSLLTHTRGARRVHARARTHTSTNARSFTPTCTWHTGETRNPDTFRRAVRNSNFCRQFPCEIIRASFPN